MAGGILRLNVLRAAFFLALASFPMASFAGASPECLDSNGNEVQAGDDQVLQWESSTPNQFQARAHVSGPIVEIYPDHSGHAHFAIQIGSSSNDRLEVIYNLDFGSANPSMGDDVEACGDYITSTAQSGPYPASPDGAIIHWVHSSPNPQKHPSGFLMINGQQYGNDIGNAGPKRYPQPHRH